MKFLCADLRFGFLRLSTIKECPHILSLYYEKKHNFLMINNILRLREAVKVETSVINLKFSDDLLEILTILKKSHFGFTTL